METEIRSRMLPIAETWVVEETGEIVAFMALLDDLIGETLGFLAERARDMRREQYVRHAEQG